jgi:hypothetical protein
MRAVGRQVLVDPLGTHPQFSSPLKPGLAHGKRVAQRLTVPEHIIETLLRGPDENGPALIFAVEVDDLAIRLELGRILPMRGRRLRQGAYKKSRGGDQNDGSLYAHPSLGKAGLIQFHRPEKSGKPPPLTIP